MYLLSFYEVDCAYGGPEEGGWWYNTYRHERTFKLERNEDRAYALASRANRLLTHLQRDKRNVGSVLYTGGRYCVSVHEDIAPQWEPTERPHYE